MDNKNNSMHIEVKGDELYVNGEHKGKALSNGDREKKYAHYIDDFYKIACRVLENYPDEFEEFQKQWKERNFRWAYIPYMEISKKDNIKLSKEEDKIDAEFYGLFVN